MKDKLYLTTEDYFSDHLWDIFEEKIQALWDLILHKDYFRKYLYKVCENFIDDKVYRIEARGFINAIFDDDHNKLSVDEEYQIFQEVITKMLIYDKDERWTALQLLKHPYFKEIRDFDHQ